MALGNPLPLLLSTVGDYEIERSVRFNGAQGDAKLTRTAGTSTSQNKFTFSTWVKLCRGSEAATNYGELINGYTASNDAGFGAIYFYSGSLRFAGWATNYRVTNRMFRDPSSWYHIIVAVDTTLGTAGNRVKIYVNGVEETSFSASNNPGQNDTFGISNNSAAMQIGMDNSASSSRVFDGYMAETHFIDGQQLTPDSFGETNSDTGQWVPKKYAGTHGNNGFYLSFKDNSSTGNMFVDDSANSNNWSHHNMTNAAGDGNDSRTDTPTNNKVTLNPVWPFSKTLTEGNLGMGGTGGSNEITTIGLPGTSSFYYEIVWSTIPGWCTAGVVEGLASNGGNVSSFSHSLYDAQITAWHSTGASVQQGSYTASDGTAWSTTDVVGIKYVNGTLTLYKDGTANSTTKSVAATSSTIYPHIQADGSTVAAYIRFSSDDWTETPTGVDATWEVDVARLPEPTIKNGKEHFNIELYTGNDSDGHARTGLGFQPNLVWIKDRGDGNHHRVYDSVRGVNAALLTSDGNAEDQYATYGQFESFDSDGFTVGIGTGSSGQRGEATNSAEPHVAWCWKESATAGFDIVSYTGTGSSRTVSHNLGVAPEMIIIKNRDDDENWIVYHAGQASDAQTDYLILNDGSGIGGDDTWLNDTAPTSSQWEYSGGGNSYNANGDDYIAYVFASVEGYSKFGSYKGNGNADGTFVYCGFRPAYIVTKRVETTPNAYWNVFDTARDPYNSGTTADFKRLLVHGSGAEATNHVNYTPPDILSNGFKLRHGGADKNYSGKRFIFFAFAETPFKYANAR